MTESATVFVRPSDAVSDLQRQAQDGLGCVCAIGVRGGAIAIGGAVLRGRTRLSRRPGVLKARVAQPMPKGKGDLLIDELPPADEKALLIDATAPL